MQPVHTFLALALLSVVTASVACAEQSANSAEHQRAVKRIEELPEYKSWKSLVSANPQVHAAMLPAADRQVRIGRRCCWSVSIYEAQGSQLHLWQTFWVSQGGKYVFGEDLEGNQIPIVKWRAMQKSKKAVA